MDCAEEVVPARKGESIKNLTFTVSKIYSTVSFSYLNGDCLLFRFDLANYVNADTALKITKSVSIKSDKISSLWPIFIYRKLPKDSFRSFN